jgi:regulator of nucleoside diphosphate kinase
MVDGAIKITQYDLDRLKLLLRDAGSTQYRGSQYLKQLREELERADVLQPQEIPPDVITMNSKVILQDTETSEVETYTLVFPEDADMQQGKISILAPIGTARYI